MLNYYIVIHGTVTKHVHGRLASIVNKTIQIFYQSIKSIKMKAIKTLVLVTLFTLSSQISVYASNTSDELKSASQQIEKLLKFSDTIIYDEVVVNIKFKVNENDKIVVISDDSDNYDISKFIQTSLNYKELSIVKESNYKFYSVPIKFLPTTK